MFFFRMLPGVLVDHNDQESNIPWLYVDMGRKGGGSVAEYRKMRVDCFDFSLYRQGYRKGCTIKRFIAE